MASLVGPGEWTTYGEIARVALGSRGARIVGRAAAQGRLPNWHRVLRAGGSVSHGVGNRARAEGLLAVEGVRFSKGRADPARHVTWLDLEARLGDQRAELGGGVG